MQSIQERILFKSSENVTFKKKSFLLLYTMIWVQFNQIGLSDSDNLSWVGG